MSSNNKKRAAEDPADGRPVYDVLLNRVEALATLMENFTVAYCKDQELTKRAIAELADASRAQNIELLRLMQQQHELINRLMQQQHEQLNRSLATVLSKLESQGNCIAVGSPKRPPLVAISLPNYVPPPVVVAEHNYSIQKADQRIIDRIQYAMDNQEVIWVHYCTEKNPEGTVSALIPMAWKWKMSGTFVAMNQTYGKEMTYVAIRIKEIRNEEWVPSKALTPIKKEKPDQ